MINLLDKGKEEKLQLALDVIDKNIGLLDSSIVNFITECEKDSRGVPGLFQEDFAFLVTYVLLDVFGSQEALYNTLYNDEQWQRWSRYDEYWKLGIMRIIVERTLSYALHYAEPDDFTCPFNRHMETDADYVSVAANRTIIKDKALVGAWVQKNILTPAQLEMYAPIPAKKADGGVKLSDSYNTWRTVTYNEYSKMYVPSRATNQTIRSDDIKLGIIWVPVSQIDTRGGAFTFILPKNILDKYNLPHKE